MKDELFYKEIEFKFKNLAYDLDYENHIMRNYPTEYKELIREQNYNMAYNKIYDYIAHLIELSKNDNELLIYLYDNIDRYNKLIQNNYCATTLKNRFNKIYNTKKNAGLI